MSQQPLMIELDAIADSQIDQIIRQLDRIATALEKSADKQASDPAMSSVHQGPGFTPIPDEPPM